MAQATENTTSFVEVPIWADYMITIPLDSEYVSYRVIIDEKVVYNGNAYSADGVNAVIKVNHIIRNYIDDVIDIEENGIQDNKAYVKATIRLSYDDWNTSIQYMKVYAYYDYSYEMQESKIMSDPILKVIDPRQKFLFTLLNLRTDKDILPLRITQNTTEEYTTSDNGLFTLVKELNTTGRMVAKLNNGESIIYTIKNTCKPYCLYYLNSRGGWDSMIFDGKILQKASTSIHSYNREYDNTSSQFNVTNYMKIKQDKWQLTTGYLTDAQSKKMHNVYDTTKAYLHIFEDDKIIPVTISDTSYDVKTYRNQGRKLFTYTVNVESSQLKQIR